MIVYTTCMEGFKREKQIFVFLFHVKHKGTKAGGCFT